MLRLASRTARAAAAGAARPAHALADAAAGLQSLRLLVVDGYDQKGRDDLAAGGASVASELYRSMLTRHSPVPVTVDVLFPSDPGYQQPSQEELKSYDGIGWTGCSLTVYKYKEDMRVARQLALATASCAAAGVPSFGSCWAIQIATVAAGGVCAKSPLGREQGLARKIALTPAGAAHPMFAGKPRVFDAFSAHEDEVTQLPTGASLLAGNAWSAVHAADIALGPPGSGGAAFWGVQYHPEYDLHELARLTYCRVKKFVGMGIFRSEAAAHAYVEQLEALHADPGRKDLAWALGMDGDVLDAAVREVEVSNWVRHQVLPYARRRAGL